MKTPGHGAVKKLVILGGGYAGIRVALDLARKNMRNLEITLISNKPHFEYYPTLYRVAVGFSALQVAIPLTEIFANTDVKVIEDSVTRIDLEHKQIVGGIESPYSYDYLVLAVGAETSYFNLPGLPELSFGFKSVPQALQLRHHIHEMLQPVAPEAAPEEKVISTHFVVVGGGPTGTELSSELVEYARRIAKRQGTDPGLVTVDLVEGSPRVLSAMPEDVSTEVTKRLRNLGVNIYTNRAVIGQEGDTLLMKDGEIKAKTIIWTAGVKTNHLIGEISGLELDKRGRVVVDEYLQAKGQHDVFVLGDAASTQYSGLAQTANIDGGYLARIIAERASGIRKHAPYVPHKPIYAIPVGPAWATVLWGNTRFYGITGYWLRRLADLRYFMSMLPLGRALAVWRQHDNYTDDCPLCEAGASSVS